MTKTNVLLLNFSVNGANIIHNRRFKIKHIYRYYSIIADYNFLLCHEISYL